MSQRGVKQRGHKDRGCSDTYIYTTYVHMYVVSSHTHSAVANKYKKEREGERGEAGGLFLCVMRERGQAAGKRISHTHTHKRIYTHKDIILHILV
jgi:hypothetical protein